LHEIDVTVCVGRSENGEMATEKGKLYLLKNQDEKIKARRYTYINFPSSQAWHPDMCDMCERENLFLLNVINV
jgi:hypothetical protein